MLICFNDQKVSIEIRDDGKGFDIHQILHTPVACHFGLIGMRERAQSVGGELLIKSEPGKGCKITLDIPNAGNSSEGLSIHAPHKDTDCR
jgi:signal transduction histidine kinase